MADVLLGLGFLLGGALLTLIPSELVSTAHHRRACRERYGVDLTWWQAWREGWSRSSTPGTAGQFPAPQS